MQVILLDNIPSLGKIGDEINVARGFARNWLFPQKKALPATAENHRIFTERRAQLESLLEKKMSLAQKRAKELVELKIVTVAVNVDENNNLYGSVGPKAISDALSQMNIAVDKREILMDSALTATGEHTVKIRLHADLEVEISVAVVPVHP